FFLLECDSKLTHYHPNWLNFNSDNYPARGGKLREIIASVILSLAVFSPRMMDRQARLIDMTFRNPFYLLSFET
ncbi:hypothetical protein, partial [Vibrio vulnificus]|uniref:hypothetical protein n=1 Tax=Vibrio vulnificus TaxID=672 RepID=UPI003ED8608F